MVIPNPRLARSIAVAAAVVLLGAATPSPPSHGSTALPKAVGAERRVAPATCDAPPFHEFDFWIGDWRVFDAASHRLVAFDHVVKRAAGCIVVEHLDFLTDMYRRPGVVRRLAGISISRFDGEHWLQMWADNQWGAIMMRGKADGDGRLVFETVIPSRGREVRLVYEERPGGDVRIRQYVAPAGSGAWSEYGDLLYRPNR
ncbi:MAG TPA: hypothetical protein VND80_01820 [Steroidobacteraceae bacterium]|nr:hypothetical protein [Steroidobacteraceae bacterium]